MPNYALLISPRADAAFFERANDVAVAEISGVPGVSNVQLHEHGPMRFVHIDAAPETLPDLLRMSCVQGAFSIDKDALTPLDTAPAFHLHPDFVWGEKYRGKTNEPLTQLLINLALQQMPDKDPNSLRLLDPMCGRGTSLLWAMRYGISATGIEQDATVLNDVQRGLKKWTKLHRQKHKLTDGWVQKANKANAGKYLDFTTPDATLRLIVGDSVNTYDLTRRKQFDLLITDLPYGVQHMGGPGSRNPLETIKACAPGWAKALSPGGAMVLAFNSYIPKRADLIAAFDGLGLAAHPTDLAHRMSEAILRDVLVLRKS